LRNDVTLTAPVGSSRSTFHDASIGSQALPQIPSLTGLRFIAAALVLVAHAADWLGQFSNSTVENNLSFLSMYGMPLFFVLSGFVIHYNYRRLFITRTPARATAEFAVARFARLFPLYFCLLIASICADNLVSDVQGDRSLFYHIVGYYVTLTQSWWYIVYGGKLLINWLFGLSWSISTEAFFYVAYIPAVFVLLAIRRAKTAVFATVAYALIVTCGFVTVRHSLDGFLLTIKQYMPNYIGPSNYQNFHFQNSFYRWFFYFSPYTRMFEFFIGALTAHVFTLTYNRPFSSLERRLAGCCSFGAFLFMGVCGLLYLEIVNLGSINVYVQLLSLNFLCAPAIAVLMFYVARYETWLSNVLSLPWMITLGDASYSIYLLHYFTLRIFVRSPPPFDLVWGLETILRISCGIAFTLIASYATYRLIEMPCRNGLRRNLAHLIDRIVPVGPENNDLSTPKPARKWRSAAIYKTVLTGEMIGVIATFVLVGQMLQSQTVWRRMHRFWFGARAEIEIIDATYGMNCKAYTVPNPNLNTVKRGNATEGVSNICGDEVYCQLSITPAIAGDPANGCEKDFSVTYHCSGSTIVKKLYISAEALGKSVELECRPPDNRR
jgi:peptidoglycan/LPS O-acetylase OafA/YrhL